MIQGGRDRLPEVAGADRQPQAPQQPQQPAKADQPAHQPAPPASRHSGNGAAAPHPGQHYAPQRGPVRTIARLSAPRRSPRNLTLPFSSLTWPIDRGRRLRRASMRLRAPAAVHAPAAVRHFPPLFVPVAQACSILGRKLNRPPLLSCLRSLAAPVIEPIRLWPQVRAGAKRCDCPRLRTLFRVLETDGCGAINAQISPAAYLVGYRNQADYYGPYHRRNQGTGQAAGGGGSGHYYAGSQVLVNRAELELAAACLAAALLPALQFNSCSGLLMNLAMYSTVCTRWLRRWPASRRRCWARRMGAVRLCHSKMAAPFQFATDMVAARST